MVARCLVYVLWLTGSFGFICEGGERTSLASQFEEKATDCEEHGQAGGFYHPGQEAEKDGQGCIVLAAKPSQLGSFRNSATHSQEDSHDLVLSGMPNTEWPEVRNMPWMQGTLEPSLDGSGQKAFTKQERDSKEERGSKTPRCGTVAGISRQGSMDTYDSSISHSYEAVRHSFGRQAERAGTFPGYQPSLYAIKGRNSDRGRQEEADPSSRSQVYGSGFSRDVGNTIGDVGGEGEDLSQFQGVDAWTPQQAHQVESSDSCTEQKDYHSGSRVGSFCTAHHGEDQAPLGDVPAVPGRVARALQSETRGNEADETGADNGISQPLGQPAGRTRGTRDHQCGRSDDSPERNNGYAGYSDICGGPHGGRRDLGGVGQSGRRCGYRHQGCQDASQTGLQRSGFSAESGATASENQEGQGQDREVDWYAFRLDHHPYEQCHLSMVRGDDAGSGPRDNVTWTAFSDSGLQNDLFHPSSTQHFAEYWRKSMQTYWLTVTQQASWVRGQDVGIPDFVATVCRQSDDLNCGIEVSTHRVTAQGRHSLDRHLVRKDDKESFEPRHFWRWSLSCWMRPLQRQF